MIVGNGAREALDRYFAAGYEPSELTRTDHLLAWLWVEGFLVCPHELPSEVDDDATANCKR